jgi:HEAT repeat protein
VTPEQREAIQTLVATPHKRETPTNDEFLQMFGDDDGTTLGLRLLRDAVARRDPVDVELALVVGFRFEITLDYLPTLLALASADWHQAHEDVVGALGRLERPEAVDALVHLAVWVPDYLAWDESRALAKNAIWALGGIRDRGADDALASLAVSDDPIVAAGAREQIERRR